MPDKLVYVSERLIRRAGADRVDEGAPAQLAERLEAHGERVIHYAYRLALRRRGKRIKARDVVMAAELLG